MKPKRLQSHMYNRAVACLGSSCMFVYVHPWKRNCMDRHRKSSDYWDNGFVSGFVTLFDIFSDFLMNKIY